MPSNKKEQWQWYSDSLLTVTTNWAVLIVSEQSLLVLDDHFPYKNDEQQGGWFTPTSHSITMDIWG